MVVSIDSYAIITAFSMALCFRLTVYDSVNVWMKVFRKRTYIVRWVFLSGRWYTLKLWVNLWTTWNYGHYLTNKQILNCPSHLENANGSLQPQYPLLEAPIDVEVTIQVSILLFYCSNNWVLFSCPRRVFIAMTWAYRGSNGLQMTLEWAVRPLIVFQYLSLIWCLHFLSQGLTMAGACRWSAW